MARVLPSCLRVSTLTILRHMVTIHTVNGHVGGYQMNEGVDCISWSSWRILASESRRGPLSWFAIVNTGVRAALTAAASLALITASFH